jgi:hypothetical protein
LLIGVAGTTSPAMTKNGDQARVPDHNGIMRSYDNVGLRDSSLCRR